MKPTTIALTIMLDLGDYQFKHIRLTTKFDESRFNTIRAEALQLAQSLEHVISFEIGQVTQFNSQQTEGSTRATTSEIKSRPFWSNIQSGSGIHFGVRESANPAHIESKRGQPL
jgi:hypothetical protein